MNDIAAAPTPPAGPSQGRLTPPLGAASETSVGAVMPAAGPSQARLAPPPAAASETRVGAVMPAAGPSQARLAPPLGAASETSVGALIPAKRPVVESTFRTHDGVDLFYRHWPATEQPTRGALVFFHRGHEHSGRLAHLPDELDLPQFDCFAWDARGHGRSPGPPGASPSLGP